MRVVLQRVREASVMVDAELVGAIGPGALLLVGVERGDTPADAAAMVRKLAALRFFPGRTPMDLTLAEVGGAWLVVSQFTLLGSLRQGNRPGFGRAAEPAVAETLVEAVASGLAATGSPVQTGRFGATMAVALVGDGPVTFVLAAHGGQIDPTS
ncbi:MAG: D-aminoacyl-tRNA deacylase [Planctomycetota bacterium]|nr:D-aminoacyl-tRNA deacylase [Planctomycetota bacterium]